jgi:hypothetical protein
MKVICALAGQAARPPRRPSDPASQQREIVQPLESCNRPADGPAIWAVIGVLAGGVDHHAQHLALAGHHQIVEDAALGIGQKAVALLPGFQRAEIVRAELLDRSGRSVVVGPVMRNWPICETSNRPAPERVC